MQNFWFVLERFSFVLKKLKKYFFVKIGKDFLTNLHFGQKHAILEKSTIVQSMVNSSF